MLEPSGKVYDDYMQDDLDLLAGSKDFLLFVTKMAFNSSKK